MADVAPRDKSGLPCLIGVSELWVLSVRRVTLAVTDGVQCGAL
jgi:hypothetical protein